MLTKQLGRTRLMCGKTSLARQGSVLALQGKAVGLDDGKAKTFTWIAKIKLSIERQVKYSKCWK